MLRGPVRGSPGHTQGEVGGLARGVSRPTPRGMLRDLARGISRPTPIEVGGSGQGISRPTPGGCPGPHQGGCVCTEADTPQQTGIAVGSMHPTGMHSCYVLF